MAIAFDTGVSSGDNGGSTNSLSWTHVCTGTNLALFAGFSGDVVFGSDDITGVTYNGAGLTSLASGFTDGSDRLYYVFSLIGAAAGSHTVMISCATPHYLFGASVSYSGVKQTGFPDAATAHSQAQGAGTTLTTTLNQSNNAWTLLFGVHSGNDGVAAAGAGSTLRAAGPFNVASFFDSNGPVSPANSGSMAFTQPTDSFSGMGAVMWSMVAAGGGSRGLFQPSPLTGLGAGGSGFFRDPLAAPMQMVKRNHIYVPARMAA